MRRCKAPASLSPAVQAGNPESGVATNKKRLFAMPTCRNICADDVSRLSAQGVDSEQTKVSTAACRHATEMARGPDNPARRGTDGYFSAA
jgi:hypothetical protein